MFAVGRTFQFAIELVVLRGTFGSWAERWECGSRGDDASEERAESGERLPVESE